MAKSDKTPATNLDTMLDLSATDGNGHILNGSGNSASGWETENNGSVQLGTDVHYRQGDTVQPVAVDHHGDLIYDMPAGLQVQDDQHHVPADTSPHPHAATNFDYSFDTGVGPGPHQTIEQFLASGGQFIYKIDVDPSQKTDFLTLHAVWDPTDNPSGSHVVWEDSHGNHVISDDLGTDFVTQNSQSLGFYNSLIDTDPHTKGIQPSATLGPVGTFNIEAEVIDPHHNVLADVNSILDIGGASDNSKSKLPDTLLNATLDSTATDGHGHALNGSGNPSSGWEIENSGSFQLATDVHYRQGDTVQPVSVTDKGVLNYDMPAGLQVRDDQHHVPVDTSGHAHAATNFDYSFDTGTAGGTPETIQQFLADGGQFIYKIDLDPTQKNDPLTLHAVYDPGVNTHSGVVWENSQNQIVIADDSGNAYVTQNSQSLGFYNAQIDTDPHTKGTQVSPTLGPAGTYDIEAQIVDTHHNVVADVHSTLLIG